MKIDKDTRRKHVKIQKCQKTQKLQKTNTLILVSNVVLWNMFITTFNKRNKTGTKNTFVGNLQ